MNSVTLWILTRLMRYWNRPKAVGPSAVAFHPSGIAEMRVSRSGAAVYQRVQASSDMPESVRESLLKYVTDTVTSLS